jgi:beta-lactamase class A
MSKTSKTFNIPLPQLLAVAAVIVATHVGMFMYFTAEKCSEHYEWLNHKLRCESGPVISKAAYLSFTNQLKAEIQSMTEEGKVATVAVYFRDLHNGPTFGINDEEAFIPASLLKLPILLTYLKAVEDDPALLKRTLTGVGFNDGIQVTQDIMPQEIIKEGGSYTVEDLLWRMIAYSDNRASTLLLTFIDTNVPASSLAETFFALGLAEPDAEIANESLTVKSYASLFRILYNASFLSNELSEKALHYLSQVKYDKALRAGVPTEVPVAHKFGERAMPNSSLHQLHDCGVVYYPGNPYSLCVMTRGDNFAELEEVISHVSRMVYEEVDSRRF